MNIRIVHQICIHEDAFTSGKEPDKYKTGNLQVLMHLLHSFNIETSKTVHFNCFHDKKSRLQK
jgi:hypothetical protein